MKKLSVFVLPVLILLFGLSGCVTPRRMSSRYDILNAVARENETKRAKHAKKAKQGPTIEQILNSWKGCQISEFIRLQGPATQISPDGAGGQIYVWKKMSRLPRATTRLIEHWDHYFRRPECQ